MSLQILMEGLLPIILVIALGFGMKKIRILEENQWNSLERISFLILIPALIIKTLSTADLGKIEFTSLAFTLFVSLLMIILFLAVLFPLLTLRSSSLIPAYTSIFQTATRWNAFIAIALISNLFGDTAIAITALGMIVLMPFINIVNIFMLTWLLTEEKISLRALLWKLTTNPIIVGCLIGISIQFLSIPVWRPVFSMMNILGDASLGIILLSVGAGIRISEISATRYHLFASCLLKLFIMPILALSTGLYFGLQGVTLTVVVLIAAMPTAMNGYILAKEMGGDAPLYANASSFQILLSFLTIPAWIQIVSMV